MTAQQLRALMKRVETWPASAQEELLRAAQEIEAELGGTDETTPEEAAGVGRGQAGRSIRWQSSSLAVHRLDPRERARLIAEAQEHSRLQDDAFDRALLEELQDMQAENADVS